MKHHHTLIGKKFSRHGLFPKLCNFTVKLKYITQQLLNNFMYICIYNRRVTMMERWTKYSHIYYGLFMVYCGTDIWKSQPYFFIRPIKANFHCTGSFVLFHSFTQLLIHAEGIVIVPYKGNTEDRTSTLYSALLLGKVTWHRTICRLGTQFSL